MIWKANGLSYTAVAQYSVYAPIGAGKRLMYYPIFLFTVDLGPGRPSTIHVCNGNHLY
jgi:hypothetical protein